ncbi:fungal-specific transcription factor domain-containing protein [Daldinia eschscholtzii]|nr:fungal-specific transcription factor domain-containing protein [Daldinia eschscholtzii]
MANQGNDRKPCYNCVKRRIVCDKTDNQCVKCTKKNLKCPGYGVRYRFAKGATNSSRMLATASEGEHAKPKRPRKPYKWIECSKEKLKTVSRASKPSSTMNKTSPLDCSDPMATIPSMLSEVDPRIRLHFLHFAAHVSPFMVLFDDEANGYRHNILPVAHAEPLVQKAVCIASAFHLSGQQPHLRAPAEIVRASLIRRLSETSAVNPDLSETTWATIVLLIVADLVIGHEDVETLYGLLAAFFEARGPLKESATQLEKFLYFQSCIIGFFTRPFSALEARPIPPPRMSGDPVALFKGYVRGLENCKKQKSPQQRKGYESSSYFSMYAESFRLAGEIYTTRAESEMLPASLEYYMEDRVQQIKTICEQIDPSTPGSHVVVWPIFVAAAESVSEDHREYFITVLKKIHGMTGYANILRGVTVLPELWDQRGSKSWTSAVLEHKGLLVF